MPEIKAIIKPAYLRSLVMGLKIARWIAMTAKGSQKEKFFLGIEGPFSAGKTTFTETLNFWLRRWCGITSTKLGSDQVLFSRETRNQMKENNPSAWEENQSWYRFDQLRQIMTEIQLAKPGEVLTYNGIYKGGTTDDVLSIEVPSSVPFIILIEGIYILRPELRKFYDYVIYLDITPKESWRRQEKRAKSRGYEWPKLREQIERVYLPSYSRYLEEFVFGIKPPNLIIDAITFRRFLNQHRW